MRLSRGLVIASLALSLPLSVRAQTAFAQSHDPAVAGALFTEGRRLLQKGDLANACPKFEESFRLDPAPGALLLLAECEEKLGKLAQAYQHFRDAEGMLKDARSQAAGQRAAALEKRIAYVTIEAPSKTGARVLRDDVELSSAAFGVPLPTDPGKHVFRFTADGRSEKRVEIDLSEGERRTILFDAAAASMPAPRTAEAAPPPATPAKPERPLRASDREPNRTPAYVAFGVGAVGLVTAGVGLWQVLDAKSVYDKECAAGTCKTQAGVDAASRGNTFTVVTVAGSVLAVAGVGVGVYLWQKASSDARSTALVVQPNGLLLRGTF